MKPVDFPGTNFELATNQPQYLPLRIIRTEEGVCISCWEFSDEEWEELSRTRRLYIEQSTFNRGFNPILPVVNLADGLDFSIKK